MKCEKCNKEFRGIQGLNYHLSINHREVNKDCFQFYIEKYKTENDFPWKIKKPEFKICECCFKEFKREFALQMHLMSGKKNNTPCYQFYINKYKIEDDFPTRIYSATKLHNYQVCECCSKKFKRVIHHILTYSPICYQYYINKYGSENNFPDEIKSRKKGICLDCGKETHSIDADWCINCYRNNHHLQDNPEAIQKIISGLKKHYLDPENRKKNQETQKRIFKERPELAENQRQYMLNGGAIKALCGNTNCSQPQMEFFNTVRKFNLETILNYPLPELNVLLDIAIPSLKIDLEYDGSYWHQDQQHDNERDNKIRNAGWKIYRFKDRIPSEKEIHNIILENKGNL